MTAGAVRADGRDGRPAPAVQLRSHGADGGRCAVGAGSPSRLTWRRAAPPVPGRRSQLGLRDRGSASRRLRDVLSRPPAGSSMARQVAVPAPGRPLRSREVRFFRVRIADLATAGPAGAPALRVEAGLLERGRLGRPRRDAPGRPGRDRQAPAPVLRREFELGAPVASARLYVTSLGLHQVRHQRRPGQRRPAGARLDALSPASARRDLRRHATCSRRGANVIGAVLGDGWYRGRLGWDRGRRPMPLRAGRRRSSPSSRSSSPTARASGHRDRRRAGWRRPARSGRPTCTTAATIDLRAAQAGWDAAAASTTLAGRRGRVVPFDPAVIEPRSAPPVRVVGGSPSGRCAAAGRRWLRGSTAARTSPGSCGCACAAAAATGHRAARRGARARRLAPHAVAALGARRPTRTSSPTTARPCSSRPFTFHGFRYAEVETTAEVLEAEFVAISSDTPRRGYVRVLGSAPQPAARERRLVAARQLRVRADRLSAARRAARLDRRRPGVRADGVARCSTRRPSGRAGCATWRSSRTTQLGVPSVVPDVVLDGRAPVRARGLGGRRDDRAVGGLRVLRRPRTILRAAAARACGAGSTRSQAPAGADGLLARVDAVRRLARPGRADRVDPGRRRRTPTTSPTRSSRTARGSRPMPRLSWASQPAATSTERSRDERRRRDLEPLVGARADHPDRLRRRARSSARARRRAGRASRRRSRDSCASATGASRPASWARRSCCRRSRTPGTSTRPT